MAATRVLTPDEIDVLELALHDLLLATPKELRGGASGELVLTDLENTPVATLSERDELVALRPLAFSHGPLCAAGVRLSWRRPRRPGSIGIWLSALPTREEEAELDELLNGPTRVVLTVPTARGELSGPRVHSEGLLRYAKHLARCSSDVSVVVVPWPVEPERFDGLVPSAIAEALGVDSILTPIEDRAEARPDAAALIEESERKVVDALYSPLAAELTMAARAHAHPQGQVIFFTGLSGSGKSTLARTLTERLMGEGRTVSLLDGDEVRHHMSRGLTFSREDREINVERIGYATSLVAKHGGLAIAAPIAPFESSRTVVRQLVEGVGASFHLVWVSTPLEICEARDRKGLYRKARAGEIAEFTGISSPYEEPEDADLVIDTSSITIDEALERVLALVR
ncbi:adenylyl-sulfate kinase [Brachybacterium sp. DNPG3]